MRAVAVDGVVLSDGRILLIRRAKEPYKGFWALPGGFLEEGETVEEGVVREVKEETGIDVEVLRMVGVYSKPERDPRGTVSVAFLCSALTKDPRGGDDAEEARWFPVEELKGLRLAFDHREIIEDALR